MGRLVGKVMCTVGAGRSRVFPSRSPSIQSHGNDGIFIFLVFGAKRAVVAAVPFVKERDAVALYRILAKLFALLNVRHLSRRVVDVFLSGVRVAVDLGPDLHPWAWSLGNVCKRRVKRNSAYVAVGPY